MPNDIYKQCFIYFPTQKRILRALEKNQKTTVTQADKTRRTVIFPISARLRKTYNSIHPLQVIGRFVVGEQLISTTNQKGSGHYLVVKIKNYATLPVSYAKPIIVNNVTEERTFPS
jgi:hypothetical protein